MIGVDQVTKAMGISPVEERLDASRGQVVDNQGILEAHPLVVCSALQSLVCMNVEQRQ